MGSLGEHGLRRLAKVVDQAEQTVHAILLDQVGVYAVGEGAWWCRQCTPYCWTRCVWGGGATPQAEQTVHAILLDQVCVCGGETTPLHDA